MHFLLKLSALAAVAVASATFASADTLTLGSYASIGGTNPGFANTAVYFAPGQPVPPAGAISPTGIIPGVPNPTYALTNDGTWAGPLSMNGKTSQYVSLDPFTGPVNGGHALVVEPNGAYGYHSYFTSAGDTAFTTGSLTVLADDTVDVYLNGHMVLMNSQSPTNTYAQVLGFCPELHYADPGVSADHGLQHERPDQRSLLCRVPGQSGVDGSGLCRPGVTDSGAELADASGNGSDGLGWCHAPPAASPGVTLSLLDLSSRHTARKDPALAPPKLGGWEPGSIAACLA